VKRRGGLGGRRGAGEEKARCCGVTLQKRPLCRLQLTSAGWLSVAESHIWYPLILVFLLSSLHIRES